MSSAMKSGLGPDYIVLAHMVLQRWSKIETRKLVQKKALLAPLSTYSWPKTFRPAIIS